MDHIHIRLRALRSVLQMQLRLRKQLQLLQLRKQLLQLLQQQLQLPRQQRTACDDFTLMLRDVAKF